MCSNRQHKIATFDAMQTIETKSVNVENHQIKSLFLKRSVKVDVYLPQTVLPEEPVHLLLLNDGQNLPEMNFANLLSGLIQSGQIQPLLCVGIHAGDDRRNEYAAAKIKDYEGRGGEVAQAYQQFVLQELLPFISIQYSIEQFASKGFAGFSMGGLSALDTVWHHPKVFSIAGVFSGSLWWRTKALDEGYNEDTDRILHRQVREGAYQKGLKFYFTTGSLDETADRNNNGIIDSIDDTLGLITELEARGYQKEKEIK